MNPVSFGWRTKIVLRPSPLCILDAMRPKYSRQPTSDMIRVGYPLRGSSGAAIVQIDPSRAIDKEPRLSPDRLGNRRIGATVFAAGGPGPPPRAVVGINARRAATPVAVDMHSARLCGRSRVPSADRSVRAVARGNGPRGTRVLISSSGSSQVTVEAEETSEDDQGKRLFQQGTVMAVEDTDSPPVARLEAHDEPSQGRLHALSYRCFAVHFQLDHHCIGAGNSDHTSDTAIHSALDEPAPEMRGVAARLPMAQADRPEDQPHHHSIRLAPNPETIGDTSSAFVLTSRLSGTDQPSGRSVTSSSHQLLKITAPQRGPAQ